MRKSPLITTRLVFKEYLMLKRVKPFVALMAGVALCGAVFAHGDKHHHHTPSTNGVIGEIKSEQKDWGIAGKAMAVKRDIDVTMGDDMRFQPSKLEVKQGETIRFRVKNKGRLLHEFVIGTPEENAKHAELMMKFPGMEHDEPHMVHVKAGETGDIIWTFNRAGTFQFACLIAGHFQAGMVGTITVSASQGGAKEAKKTTVAVELADGEIRRINKSAGTITLKHGDIPSIQMPPMTMVFGVAEKAMLEGLKEGDKVRFNVKQDSSNYTVTEIQKAQ